MSKPKILLLNSGGADATCTALLLEDTGYDVYSLFIDYGQPNVDAEWESVQWNMSTILEGNTEGRLFKTKLELGSKFEDKAYEAEQQEIYLRNFVFMSYACQLAYSLNIPQIALGYLNFQEMDTYVDDNPLFLQGFHKLIHNSFGMRLLTPVAGFEKEMVYTTLLDNDIDPESLPFCNTPKTEDGVRTKPCGECHKCVYTKQVLTKLKRGRQK